jgi:hypothetical protein
MGSSVSSFRRILGRGAIGFRRDEIGVDLIYGEEPNLLDHSATAIVMARCISRKRDSSSGCENGR